MKAIVFIDTQKSGSSREAIKAAEQLGYYTVLLTNRTSFVEKRTEFPDVHLMQLCNLQDLDELRNVINSLLLRAIEICAIVGFTDAHCHTACLLAEEFCKNHFSTKAIENMLNKITSREILLNSPYSPKYFILSNELTLSKDEVENNLPLIIKSPNSSGSKDVLKVNSYEEFQNAMGKLLEKYPEEQVLAEEFLNGPQYLVETLFFDNKLHIVAIFKQDICFSERFIVMGYSLVLNTYDKFYEKLKEAVEFIVKSHGLECGPCHLEMRYSNNQWKLIEINPRISGGGMNNLIEAGLGISLVKETLKLATGQCPDLEPKYKSYTFAQYVTVTQSGTLDRVTGRNRALNSPGVKKVFIKPKKGAFLIPPLSMGNRYAYVIATGESEDEARKNAQNAASQIQFWIIPDSIKEISQDPLPDGFKIFEPPSIDINRVRDFLAEEGKSETTIKTSVSHIQEYLSWFKGSFGKDCSSLERKNIMEYIYHLREIQKDSITSVKRKLSSLSKLNSYLIREGIQTELIIDKEIYAKATSEDFIDKITKYSSGAPEDVK